MCSRASFGWLGFKQPAMELRVRFAKLLLALGLLIAVDVSTAVEPLRPVAVRPEHGISVACRIVDVHDGDTVTCEITRRVRVRLLDCWAPEVNGAEKPRGIKSRDALRAIALQKSGTLYVPTEGNDEIGDVMTFDRVLGHVWLDDDPSESLSQKQVGRGLATKTKKLQPAQ